MRRRHSLLSHLSQILLLGGLVLSAPLVLTQTIQFSKKTPVQFVAFARVPRAKTHIAYPESPLSPRQKSGFQTDSEARSFPREAGYSYYRQLLTNKTVVLELRQPSAMGELRGKSGSFIGRTPKQWLSSVPVFNKVLRGSTSPADDLQYYGRRIPVADRLVLGISAKAKSHPHLARVFQIVQPQF